MPGNVSRLLTFAHSHYCEKARWALDAAGVDYVEERHLPLLHRRHTRRAGGGSVPVLVTSDGNRTDSAGILRYAAAHARARPLLPTNSEHRSTTLELEQYFDRELGPHARRWAYRELLPVPRMLDRCMTAGVRRSERLVAPFLLPIVRPMIRRAFRITPASAARSLEHVEQVFAAVAERLADGRRYLVDAEFGAADLTFAALAAPVLLPPGFGGAMPALEDAPAPMRAQVERLRTTPAGAFALGLYREHRRPRTHPSP
jgi:glutathione S-transferase